MNNVTVLLYPGSLAYNCLMSMQLSLWKAEWKWILFNCSCLIWFIVSKAVTFILFWPYIGSKSPKTSIINFLMSSNMCFVCWCITTVNNIHLHSWIIVCTSVNWSYLIHAHIIYEFIFCLVSCCRILDKCSILIVLLARTKVEIQFSDPFFWPLDRRERYLYCFIVVQVCNLTLAYAAQSIQGHSRVRVA